MDVDLEFLMCVRGSVAKIMTQKKKKRKNPSAIRIITDYSTRWSVAIEMVRMGSGSIVGRTLVRVEIH